jgi:hypothetical protein
MALVMKLIDPTRSSGDVDEDAEVTLWEMPEAGGLGILNWYRDNQVRM